MVLLLLYFVARLYLVNYCYFIYIDKRMTRIVTINGELLTNLVK